MNTSLLHRYVMASVAMLLAGAAVWCLADPPRQTPEALIRAKLASVRQQLVVERVEPSEMPGMYRVEIAGGEILHVSADGNFVFGDLWTIKGKELVNLTDVRHNEQRRDMMSRLKVQDMIVFAPPKGGTRAVVDVFTDVDCPYCQRLHSQIAEYNALGIEIRYLAYPRAGPQSPTAQKLVSAWCSDNRQDALTRLKRRETIPMKTCANPVAQQFQLGGEMGVTGTPALLLADGRLLAGYMPPEDLANVLGLPVALHVPPHS